jgi:hypothetical protein
MYREIAYFLRNSIILRDAARFFHIESFLFLVQGVVQYTIMCSLLIVGTRELLFDNTWNLKQNLIGIFLSSET